MNNIVSITSQGQVTIPKKIRDAFGITGATKAVVKKEGKKIIVEPKADFSSLAGSLFNGIKLTDGQLREARESFAKEWADTSNV